MPNSGILISPLQKHTFKKTSVYLRCIDGWAEARVVPFIVDSSGGSTVDDSQVAADEQIDQLFDDIFD